MTTPMDNSTDNPSGERVQFLFNKNIELENKRRKAAQARVPSDPNIWLQMRENYEAIILEDHAFSERHETEVALWQLHYRRIEEFRAHFNAALASTGSTASQNGRGHTGGGPNRLAKIRTQFRSFLSETTGFYHDFMLKIRAKYGLPLGYFSDESGTQASLSNNGNTFSEVNKGLISCHRCLIYLGDLARYKGLYGESDSKTRDFAAASSYYLQAASLWPSSGNPHHQLAILASYSSDELVAIYRYFRSLAVEAPFTTARDNLIIAFEKNRQNYSQLLGDGKVPSVKTMDVSVSGKGRGKADKRPMLKDKRAETSLIKRPASSVELFKIFSVGFVRLNGILFTRTSLETFGEVLSVVKREMVELLSSGPNEEYSFGSDAAESGLAIVRLVAILIFTVHNVNKESENQSYAEILQRSALLKNAFAAIFEFMGLILERCTQLSDPSTSYLLPGIMVFIEWLAFHQNIAVGSEVEEKPASARLTFWKHCVSFLNKILSSTFVVLDDEEDETCFFNISRYDEGETSNRLALFEDYELRGFVPLLPAQLILDFSRKHSLGSDSDKKARVQRIVAAGKALVNVVQVEDQDQRIYFDKKMKKFIIGIEPQVSHDSLLTGSSEVPRLNCESGKNLAEGNRTKGPQPPKPQLYFEGEEEDEVIVFKPSMNDKQDNGVISGVISLEHTVSGVGTGGTELGNDIGQVSAGIGGLLMQNGGNTSSKLTSTVINNSSHYPDPNQSHTSKWLVEHGALANEVTSLNLGIGLSLQDRPGTLQPTAFSHSFPQSLGFSMGNNFPVQIPDAVPSKFDAITVPATAVNGPSRIPTSVASAATKKNPVSRPVRHLGPPPGFRNAPSKSSDESSSAMMSTNGNQSVLALDDYSWMDDYGLPSANQNNGYRNSINHLFQTHHPVSKSSSSLGMVNFPFPGKQASGLEVQMERQNVRADNQLSEQMKLLQEQQHQLLRGTQAAVGLPQQYQGQSPWEGRFAV